MKVGRAEGGGGGFCFRGKGEADKQEGGTSKKLWRARR